MCKKKLFVCSFFILLLLCGCHNRKTQIKSQKLESATTLEQEISKKTETRKKNLLMKQKINHMTN